MGSILSKMFLIIFNLWISQNPVKMISFNKIFVEHFEFLCSFFPETHRIMT